MAHAIYKYPFPAAEQEFEVVLPQGAQILEIGEQRGTMVMWALVDTDPETIGQVRKFRIYATGEAIEHPRTLKPVGTFFSHGGVLVWHLFEIPEQGVMAW